MPYTEFHYTPTGTGVISGKEVLEQTEDAINDLGGQISGDVQTAIDTANNALNTANTASADAQNAVNTANTAYTAATNAQNTANAAQNTASNALTAAQNAQNDVNALGNRVTTAENNISQNTSDISGLTTRMGTAEGNITTLQNDVITAQGTATSAQNTATMARQQAYVLRYSSTAITDNSTIAYSTLDNTDNIKADDKIIDVDGKIFSIVSVDSDNSTVTVGSALIDLALDANVMHLSGNETAAGIKTFSSNVNVYNSDSATDTANIILKNSKTERGSTTNIGEQNISFVDKDNAQIGQIKCEVDSSGTSTLTLNCTNSSNSSAGIRLRRTSTGTLLQPTQNNGCNLGTSDYRWYNVQTTRVNSLEPSSLSLPSGNVSDVIDISSYITDLTGGINEYTASVNGWITITCLDCTGIKFSITNFLANGSYRENPNQISSMIPICKNQKVGIYIYGSSPTIQAVRFIPCQGNV